MSSNSVNKAAQKGFTLLEVLIAMAILAFISFAIYQATVETYKLRDVLSHEGDFHNSIRLSMGIMQRDVSLLYSPLLAVPPKPQGATPPPGGQPPGFPPPGGGMGQPVEDLSQLGPATQFWGQALDKTGIRPSRFVGTATKMSFISLSNLRVYKDSPESEFAKVSYEIKRDDAPAEGLEGTSVLVKTASPNAWEDDERKDKLLTSYTLIRGLKKVSFGYYRRDKEQWSDNWDSDTESYRDLYPDIISIKMEVAGPYRLFFEGEYHFRPEIPIYGIDPSM